jgi:SagB-type dehydrogenase family enzyme
MALLPSRVERYHVATKYDPETLGALPAPDPAAQPPAFKTWHQARALALPRSLGLPTGEPGRALDAAALGRVLLHTYGVTAVGKAPGTTHLFRAAPSAGGLYPSELYVATRRVAGVPPGIHAYLAREHALVACWDGDFGPELARYAFEHPALERAEAVLIVTAMPKRGSWRYGDRAYRRVLLDAGHLLGNAALAATCEGRVLVPIGDFADDAVDGLLLLDPEQEVTLALAALGPSRDVRESLRSPAVRDADEPETGAWIRAAHDAARIRERTEALPPYEVPDAPPPGPEVALADAPLEPGAPVLEAIRRRRSTRAFRRGTLPLADVGRVLAHAYRAPEGAAGFARDALTTWLVVAAVEGLAAGVYRYESAHHVLRLARAGDPRRMLQHATLGQELGGEAACTIVHTCDLPAAVARYGERAYRYVHLDAGLLGERLDLAALRLGHGASGIGGFFDDDVARLVGVPTTHAIVYLTVLGLPAT